MVRRRLLWALALGVPLGACAAIVVATGAFVGTTYLAIASGTECHGGPAPPFLPASCGDAAARATAYVMAALALASLTPYATLLRRWVCDAPPPPRSPRPAIALARVLTGWGIGILLCASSLTGWSWLWMTLNNHLLHIGCLPAHHPSAPTSWICEGNSSYGVPLLALVMTVALGCAYPVLYLLADRPAAGRYEPVEVGR